MHHDGGRLSEEPDRWTEAVSGGTNLSAKVCMTLHCRILTGLSQLKKISYSNIYVHSCVPTCVHVEVRMYVKMNVETRS